MESTTSRLILPGTEYDYLFPKALYKDETINPDADVYDTVAFIKSIIPKTLGDTRRLVEEVLWDNDLKKFCSKAWNFAYHHIPYKRDEEGIEQVRRPARSWSDRHSGGGIDCDCYSVFLGSCLFNAGIKFHLRITKYPKEKGETPYWQHIYIAVPKNQKASYSMDRREDFYILDCVKDRFNSEEPYLEFKDYPMRLDYLNGLDSVNDYKIPSNVDAQDLASTNDIEELGELGEWMQADGLGRGPKKTKAERKEHRKQFFKKGLKVFRKILNPVTIALRNSVLLAMKVNFMDVASKIRFAYLKDVHAIKMGLVQAKFSILRKITDKVEKIYAKAGGNVKNFRLAVLKGHGNKDRKVPLDALAGLGEIYGDDPGDEDEIRILNADHINGLQGIHGLGGLGVLPIAAALAAAATALAPIAKALSSVKGMFPKKDSKEAQEFDSTHDPNDPAPVITDQMLQETKAQISQEDSTQTDVPTTTTNPASTDSTSVTTTNSNTDIPSTSTDVNANSQGAAVPGMMAKAIDFVKQHPIPTTIVAGLATVGLYKFFTRNSGQGLNGLPSKRKKGRKKKKSKEKYGSKKAASSHKKILPVQLR